MPKLVWDKPSEHFYETGVDHGVLYVQNTDGTYANGVAWNGLTGVTETPSGAEETKLWADNTKYLSLRSAEEFGGTIEAYTYPDEWQQCDGSADLVKGVHVGQQGRKAFGLSYRTIVGNDTELNDYGYKLHLVYSSTVSPSERAYATVNDSPEAITFSWEFSSTPVAIDAAIVGQTLKPTALITIDTSKLDNGTENVKLKNLEKKLYGYDAYTEVSEPVVADIGTYYEKNGDVYTKTTDVAIDAEKTYYVYSGEEASLPTPAEVYTLFAA